MKLFKLPLPVSLVLFSVLLYCCGGNGKKETKPPAAIDTLSVARAYNDSGLACARNEKDYQKAIAYFTKALSIKPGYDVAYSNRGNAHRLLKEFDKAIEDYNLAIASNPTDTLLHRLKAQVYYDAGDFENAIKELDIVVRMKNIDPALLVKVNSEREKAHKMLLKK